MKVAQYTQTSIKNRIEYIATHFVFMLLALSFIVSCVSNSGNVNASTAVSNAGFNHANATHASAMQNDVAPQTTVYYAGFGFLGRFDNIADKFPHANRLNKLREGKIGQLTSRFTDSLKESKFSHFKVSFESVDQNRKRPLMMALSVEREALAYSVSGHPIVEISAQLLFFDYDSKTLVGNVHIPIALNGHKSKNSAADIQAMFDQAYLSENGLISVAMNKLRSFSFAYFNGVRVQVAKVSLQSKVSERLPENTNALIMEEFVAQYLSAKLSEQGVNMIPHAKGATIGRQMAFRMTDTSAFSLQLPRADYEVNVNWLSADTIPQKRLIMHGVEMGIEIVQVAAKKPVLDVPLFNVVFTRKSKNTDQVSDTWAPLEDAFETALSDFAKQTQNPKNAWCKEHSSGREACKQLKQFKRILSI